VRTESVAGTASAAGSEGGSGSYRPKEGRRELAIRRRVMFMFRIGPTGRRQRQELGMRR
jgi:hypothetical protein